MGVVEEEPEPGADALGADPRDDEALAATLRALIADSARVEALGAAAQARASGYTRARMTDGYLDLYERLLTEAAEAPRPLEEAR